MGYGAWDASTYDTHTSAKVASGTTFSYSGLVSSGAATGAHDSLDPDRKAKSGPFAGKIVREARDSDEHPTSVAVAAVFDVTGSMGHVPRLLQTKLAELFGLLLRKGYLEHPQVLVGAYGDTEVDATPFQVGQFESDNRADETLDNLYLEGGGGGNSGESAHAIWWYLGQYAELDSLDKRGKKGYLFTIGDEVPLTVLSASDVKRHIPDATIQGDLTREQCLELAQQKFDVYHVVINNNTAKWQDSINVYTKLLGADHVIVLQDEASVAETIAVAIGLAEGTLDSIDEALDDLDDVGASDSTKHAVTKALAKFTGGGKGSVAVSTDTPADLVTTDAAARL